MAHENPNDRQPKGDHNRRLSLGLDPERFAAEAGISTEELREYERTPPDHRFDAAVAQRVGQTLERLEAALPNSQTGRNEPAPGARVDDVGAAPKAETTTISSDTTVLTEPRYTAEETDEPRRT